jgi:hypothetical protein
MNASGRQNIREVLGLTEAECLRQEWLLYAEQHCMCSSVSESSGFHHGMSTM